MVIWLVSITAQTLILCAIKATGTVSCWSRFECLRVAIRGIWAWGVLLFDFTCGRLTFRATDGALGEMHYQALNIVTQSKIVDR